jgi:Xaa-Pro aminopeptidase
MASELEEKTGRLVEMLDREALDAVLLNSQHNFAWLTGGASNGIDLSRENGAASLLVTRSGERYVIANVIELERMLAEEVTAEDFHPIGFPWQDGSLLIQKARSVIGDGGRLASDLVIDHEIPVVEWRIAPCRYGLTRPEADRYRILGRDAGAAMKTAIGTIRPGDSELHIAEKLRHELAAGEMTSVVTLVAADDRISRYRHPVPTDNAWRNTLLLVTCARRHGLIVSLSRMVSVGEPSSALVEKTQAAAYVNACMLDRTRPGITGAELYQCAAEAYQQVGHGDEIDRHHQGGAAGYKPREWVAHLQSGETVKRNQAFAWNPSITGTKVEETCIVGDNGVEIISASPDFPQITTTVNRREYHSPGIFCL